jgi:hypothetical protein
VFVGVVFIYVEHVLLAGGALNKSLNGCREGSQE